VLLGATVHIVMPFNHNLPETEAEKIMKYEHLNQEIINIWKLNNVYILLSHLGRRRGHKKLTKISRE
jgi:hypothetical protein